MRFVIKKKTIASLIILLFFALTLYIFLFDYSSRLFIVRYVVLILSALIGFYFSIQERFYKPLYYAVLFFTLWLVCWLIQPTPNYIVDNFVYTLGYIGMAAAMLFLGISYKCSLVMLLLTFVYGLVAFFRNASIYTFLTANSFNYISVLFMMVLMAYAISSSQEGKEVPWIVFLSYFIICIWATGRGGILSSGFLVVIYGIKSVSKIQNSVLRFLMRIVLGIVIVIMLMTILGDMDFINKYFGRFLDRGLRSDSRIEIWKQYFSNNRRSLTDFIFSSDIRLVRNDGNLHNSFIQAYANFGLIGFAFVIYSIIKAICSYIKNKNFSYLFLFIAIIIRAMTDKILFQGYMEPFYFYFVLYALYTSFNKKNVEALYE